MFESHVSVRPSVRLYLTTRLHHINHKTDYITKAEIFPFVILHLGLKIVLISKVIIGL